MADRGRHPRFVGFAVGRSVWWDVVHDLLDGSADHGAAVASVGPRYRHFVAAFVDAARASIFRSVGMG